jgi:uncharacterized membrane protein YvbJ
MFCGECGTENPDINRFCKNCGKPLKKPQQTQQQVTQMTSEPSDYIPPVGLSPAVTKQQPVAQPPPQVITTVTQSTGKRWPWAKIVAVLSILFGAVSLIVAPYLAGIIGVLLGIFAVREKQKLGFIGIATAVVGMSINFLYIYIA